MPCSKRKSREDKYKHLNSTFIQAVELDAVHFGAFQKLQHKSFFSKNPVLVAEADEFDRSFCNCSTYAVVTATDPDHLDIYGNVENMRLHLCSLPLK